MPEKAPITVCVTGAAGQIGYALIPMVCNGDMFGTDQPVNLNLLDLDFAMEGLGGTCMEIEDASFPLVNKVVATSDANVAFQGCDCAVLLGAFPRKQGMERKDLMEKNIGIFKAMGQAVEKNASPNIKVLVVGNPANTNALIMSNFAPKVPRKNFTAMTRLDHNRARGQIAVRAGVSVDQVQNVIIWGNHSSTQYPDMSHGTVKGKPIPGVINDDAWLRGEFIKQIQTRGAAIINARKASSALSAARSAVQHMRSWFLGTAPGEFVSMGVISDGNGYGVKDGLMYSFPCECKDGEWSIKSGLPIDDFSKEKMTITETELFEEKELAFSLL